MIFQYEELQECVTEDFERFYQMEFGEEQIFPAVLEEYRHGDGFSSIENICIHLFLAHSYMQKGFNAGTIIGNLQCLLAETEDGDVRAALGSAYEAYDRMIKEIFCV